MAAIFSWLGLPESIPEVVLWVESGGGDGLELALRFVGHLAHDTCGKKRQLTNFYSCFSSITLQPDHRDELLTNLHPDKNDPN